MHSNRSFLFLSRALSILALGGVLIWAVPAVVAHYQVQQAADAQWADLHARGAVRAAIDPGWQPFSFFSDQGWQGLDADLTYELVRRIGLSVQLDPVGYDALYDALHLKRDDIAVSAVVIDPSRAETIAYTEAYFDAGVHLVVFNRVDIRHPQDLEGKRVAVALGADGDRVARYWERRLAHLTRLTMNDEATALAAAQSGLADAALVDALAALRYTPHVTGKLPVLISVEPRLYAIAVRRDNTHLLSALNAALAELRADGTLQHLIRRWIVVNP
ncbi:MAG: transporter substrate-binding domain-containing protein [Anaerolineae bacterium]|nr:transporter substrate-binding domain-containing protein [Thermoflexales bacterium]MDW8406965.1 transporter substrate-binding domain-containing protein [Anaerolineae bacterium]